MKRISTIVVFIAEICLRCLAQQMIPQDIPTPTAASLARYGDIPVSYYTGQPIVSIPLHTLSVKGVEMPITLDYDPSGVQMNVLPSWTGHNWTLNAGGVITRKINFLPDEYIYPIEMQSSVYPQKNYFQAYDWILDYKDGQDDDALTDSLTYRIIDLEPDIFTFSFMGKTGKFFLGNDGEWKVLSDSNLDIIFDVDNYKDHLLSPFIPYFCKDVYDNRPQPKTIEGFKIRDEEGNVYEFGFTTDAIEYNVPFMMMTDTESLRSWFATSWYLTRVTDKFGNELYQLYYQRGYFTAQFYNTYTVSSVDQYCTDLWGYGNSYYSNYNPFPFDGQLDAPVYLTDIYCSNGVDIAFYSADSPLQTIDLYGNFGHSTAQGFYDDLEYYITEKLRYTDKFPKNYFFYYLQSNEQGLSQYQRPNNQPYSHILAKTGIKVLQQIEINSAFGDGDVDIYTFDYSYDSRMHLTGIHKSDDTDTIQSHAFVYDNYDYLPDNYLTKKADHWGFYNGSEYNVNSSNFYSQRNMATPYIYYGTLKKIIYPTGGASIFEYEPNTYSQIVSLDRQSMINENGSGGGLRIKSISDYENSNGTQLLKKRTFSYTNPGTSVSSGELFSRPMYSWIDWKADLSVPNAYYQQSTFRTSSIIPLSNSFGPSIGYTYVTEYMNDGSCTVYHFSNLSSALDGRFFKSFCGNNGTEPTPYDKFSERGYNRGKLLSVTCYNSSGQKVKSITNTYRNDNVENNYVVASNMERRGFGSAAFSYTIGGLYKLFYPKYDIISETDSVFHSANIATVTTKTYTKSDRNINVTYPYTHLSTVRNVDAVITSRGTNSTTTTFVYPHSVIGSPEYPIAAEDFDLKPVSTTTYTNNQFVKTSSMKYQSVSINNKEHLLPHYYIDLYNGGVRDTLITYHTFTSYGSLSTYTKKGEPKTMLYWMIYDNYLWGKSVGASPNPLTLPGIYVFEPEELSPAVKDLVNNNNERGNMLTFYTYQGLHGSTTSVIRSNGVTTYYPHDVFGRLTDIYDDSYNLLQHFDYNYKYK